MSNNIIVLNDDNFSKIARDMIVAGRRVSSQYDAMIVHFALTSDSEGKALTETARTIVLAAYPDTEPARLAGKNKNDDQRWKDARAVRAGLVAAIKRASEDVEDDTPKPVVLRVSLSGEGGGSTVVEPSHPMYDAIVMLIGADN